MNYLHLALSTDRLLDLFDPYVLGAVETDCFHEWHGFVACRKTRKFVDVV